MGIVKPRHLKLGLNWQLPTLWMHLYLAPPNMNPTPPKKSQWQKMSLILTPPLPLPYATQVQCHWRQRSFWGRCHWRRRRRQGGGWWSHNHCQWGWVVEVLREVHLLEQEISDPINNVNPQTTTTTKNIDFYKV